MFFRRPGDLFQLESRELSCFSVCIAIPLCKTSRIQPDFQLGLQPYSRLQSVPAYPLYLDLLHTSHDVVIMLQWCLVAIYTWLAVKVVRYQIIRGTSSWHPSSIIYSDMRRWKLGAPRDAIVLATKSGQNPVCSLHETACVPIGQFPTPPSKSGFRTMSISNPRRSCRRSWQLFMYSIRMSTCSKLRCTTSRRLGMNEYLLRLSRYGARTILDTRVLPT